jgi:hypothetical protein
MDGPFHVFEENTYMRRAPALKRVDAMFEQIKLELPAAPKVFLCLLPEKKRCEAYGWFIFGCHFYPSYICIMFFWVVLYFVSNQVLGRGSSWLNLVSSHNAWLQQESMTHTYLICL